MNFICPKCKAKLTVAQSGAAVCPLGHSYDRSREGYYNLFLSNAGGVHGDNRDMIIARRTFLESGAYAPLAARIAALAGEHCRSGLAVDVGCGEGYYTSRVFDVLSHNSVALSGFDISKEAVRLASKRVKGASFAVASAYDMPYADSSCDLLINVFSPLAIEESARVLKKGAKFIMAIPAPRHLYALKAVAYDEPYENSPEDRALPHFSLISEEQLSFEMELSGSEIIRSLFMMTPYAYRTSEEGRARVAALESLRCEADFILLVYERE